VREFDHFGDCFCTCALIIWTVLLQPTILKGDKAEVEARFGPFGDSVSVGAR
jgi:hypothetical protein